MSHLKPRVGISGCLPGGPVRFNGGHSRDRFVAQVLGYYVDWVAICPEAEIGLGTPRQAPRLTAGGRLAGGAGEDHTDARSALAERGRDDLAGLHGYVVKSRSPSCGRCSVRVYAGDALARGSGRGVFAAHAPDSSPLLPVEEEGRLNDPLLRETFIEQVFARQRLDQLFGGRWRARDLVDFHARHKLQLLAHDPVRCVRAGRLVATARAQPADEVAARYTSMFAEAMARRVSRSRHSNALQHAFGMVSSCLDDTRRHDVLTRIDGYRRGEVPLSVPVALIRHHAAGCRMGYLQDQTYLDPFPAALGLRNHVG